MLTKKELTAHFLILSAVMALFIILAFFNQGGLIKINIDFHSDIELFGAVVALIISVILYLKFNIYYDKYLIVLSMSFMSMGILDSVHSHMDVGDGFVFAHSAASLYGALFVSLVWFPSILEYIVKYKLSFFLFSAILSIGSAALILLADPWPSYLNMFGATVVIDTLVMHKFTSLAIFINVLAGVLFMVSSLYFYREFYKQNKKIDFLFFLFLFMSGMAEIIFVFSIIWAFDWWLWHFIRLFAFLIVFAVLIYEYHIFLKFVMDREKELIEKNRVIKESRNILKHIFDINPNILFTSDKIKGLHSANRAFLEFTGFETLEAFKEKYNCICDMFVERDGYLSKYMDEEILWIDYVVDNPYKTHKVLMIKDNQEYSFKVSATRFSDFEDMYVISLSEITDIEKISEVAEASNRAKTTFLSNMSHEIRTPLNGIIGLTHLLLDAEPTSRQEYYLSRIELTSKSLLYIINDILDYSKIQAGKLRIQNESFNLLHVLEHISGLFGYEVEKKGLELFFHMDKDIPYGLIGDQMRITQVLINLIGNAVKFTHAGEIILDINIVSMDEEKCELKFDVKDTGIGIEEEDLDKLFMEFSQVDDSYQRKYGGTGLGLTISKEFVELMGGKIRVESVYREGTTFSFTLKLDIDKKMIAEFNIRNIKKGDRVLVVDDNATSREIMYEILKSWGLEVDLSESGLKALQKMNESILKKEFYNFIFLDWKMPGLSGVETAEKILEKYKQNLILQEPTIIMITSYSKDELAEYLRAQRLPINTILTKPITPSVVYNAMTNNDHKTASQISVHQYDDELQTIYGAEVLLVEDNEINQIVIQDYIKRMNLNVTIANNGQEALYYVENNMFDIILMDIQMPVMDGITATKEIKKIDGKNEIPIIAMTATAMEKDRQESKEAGMQAHITKPIELEELKKIFLEFIKPDKKNRVLKTTKKRMLTPSDTPLPASQKMHGVDFQKLLQKLNGNRELAYKLLLDFAQKYENLDEIFHLNNIGTENFNAFIHSLKDESGNMSIDGVYNLARLIDEKDDLEKKLRFINPLYHELIDVSKSIKESFSLSHVKSENSVAPIKNIIAILNEFIASADEGYIISYEIIQELFKSLKGVVEDEDIEKLGVAFDKLDYKSVKVILVNMKKKLLKGM